MASPRGPGVVEVMRNALEGIADGMAITLVRTARSTIVRAGMDFSTAVISPTGELIGQGLCHPIHLGGMMPALEAGLARYQDGLAPGDILANNDPYEGGSHLPDIYLFKPVFMGGALVAYLCSIAHHADIGGRVPGGQGFDSVEIYQEGLRIPPVKLVDRGVPNETLYRLLERAVRVPELVLGDLQAQVAALHYGERELHKLVDRLGVEGFHTASEQLLEYSERLTRRAISTLPDGTWHFTDYVDDDGVTQESIAVAVTLAKRGDEIHVDFSGTSPQCKGAVQPVFATTKAMVYAVLRSLLGDEIPNTSGCFRPVTVTAPVGCFVNPQPPAPVAARVVGCRRANQAVWGAFAQMVPHRVFACPGGCDGGVAAAGYDRKAGSWRAWVITEDFQEVAGGGRPTKDGLEGQGVNITNIANIPVETLEAEYPIKVVEYGLAPETEGAGKFRGGLGLRRSYVYLQDDTTVQMRVDRMKRPPWGVAGGQPPAPPVVRVNRGQPGEARVGKCTLHMGRGDTLDVQWCGGGGYGDPLERDPRMVLEDVREERVTPQRARKVYGVAINGHRLEVDWPATRRQREALRRARRTTGPEAEEGG